MTVGWHFCAIALEAFKQPIVGTSIPSAGEGGNCTLVRTLAVAEVAPAGVTVNVETKP
jgi:hypothetical protein